MPRRTHVQRAVRGGRKEDFGDFYASELFCPRCQVPVPVRERLLLVLPDGELHEYLCKQCGTSVGEKTTRGRENIQIVLE
ncbi:MAG: cytoplasmic protein [Thermodesulfobacteriota bacterium]